MEDQVKNRLSEILSEASRLLSSENPTTSTSTSTVNSGTATINETLRRAHGMLRESTSSGLCRRLNRQERLRAASGSTYQRAKPTKSAPKKEKKAVEFAVLRCLDDEEEGEACHLKWDSVIANGILLLDEFDNEVTIRKALQESLHAKFPLLGTNDFDFVKVRQKKVTTLQLGPGAEYNYAVIKKMAGQGLLYVKVKKGYQFVYGAQDEMSDDLLNSAWDSVEKHGDVQEEDQQSNLPNSLERGANQTPVISGENPPDIQAENQESDSVNSLESQANQTPGISGENPPDAQAEDQNSNLTASPETSQLIHEIHLLGLKDPVEILRFLQKKLVQGRNLDVTSDSDLMEGDTNYICVDRHNILETTFEELASIENFNMTFEVDFIGEKAKDLGGPRKEWVRLMNAAMKEKYFDSGLRELLSDQYYFVGLMVGIALLQNGQLPTFMPVDVIQKLTTETKDKCIANIQRGLNVFGLANVMKEVPILLHLLTPGNHKLVARMLINLLTPEFSEEGSTAYIKEKRVYALFVKYVREVASGRREPITLSSILAFVTGAEEEPVLGFVIHPSLKFECEEEPEELQSSDHLPYNYIPTARACGNVLSLPIGALASPLPEENSLFQVYDIAFANAHFGRV